MKNLRQFNKNTQTVLNFGTQLIGLKKVHNDNNDIIREIFLKSVSRKKKIFEKVLYNLIFIFKGWTYGSGFVNDTMIKEHLFEPSEDNLVLMCGPPPMINFACQPNLDKLGYSPEMRFAY